jgi:hypothetical protein
MAPGIDIQRGASVLDRASRVKPWLDPYRLGRRALTVDEAG